MDKDISSTFQESTHESREHSKNLRWQGATKENSGQPSTNYAAKNCEVAKHSQDSLKQERCGLNEVVESDFLISPGDIYLNRKVELEDADIKEATKVSFEALCEQQHEAFSKNNKDIGRTQLIEMEIDTGDSLPVAQSPYTLPLKHYDWVHQEIETLEKSGVIERSLSRWASPVIVVPKKSAPDEPPRRRLCVDYRKVNALQPEVKRTDKGTGCLSLSIAKNRRNVFKAGRSKNFLHHIFTFRILPYRSYTGIQSQISIRRANGKMAVQMYTVRAQSGPSLFPIANRPGADGLQRFRNGLSG